MEYKFTVQQYCSSSCDLEAIHLTFLVGPHQSRLLLFLLTAAILVTDGRNEVHVCPTLKQELNNPDVAVVGGAVQCCNHGNMHTITSTNTGKKSTVEVQ